MLWSLPAGETGTFPPFAECVLFVFSLRLPKEKIIQSAV